MKEPTTQYVYVLVDARVPQARGALMSPVMYPTRAEARAARRGDPLEAHLRVRRAKLTIFAS